MPWYVDHGLSLIRMFVSNFSQFRHFRQKVSTIAATSGKSSTIIYSRTEVGWRRNLVEGMGTTEW